MGSINDRECKLTLQIDLRRWTYRNNQKPDRKMIFKEGGEWLGWLVAGKSIIIEVKHGYREDLLVRDRIWVKRNNKWQQRGEHICPSVSEYCIHKSGWHIAESGMYKAKIDIFNKKECVMERVVTFKICKRASKNKKSVN